MFKTVDELIADLQDEDWRVGRAAAFALANRKSPEVVTALTNVLRQHEIPCVRGAAALALGRGHPDVEQAISEGLVCGDF